MLSLTIPPGALLLLLSVPLITSAMMSNSCGMGRFNNGTACALCRRGTYQDVKNSTSCKPCPSGTYGPFYGAQGLDVCRDCPAGTFSTKSGRASPSVCKPCPVGKNSPPGSSLCISCKPGQYITPYCIDDGVHFFGYYFRGKCVECNDFELCFAGPMVAECDFCGPGTFTVNNTALKCEKCPEGFVARDGPDTCTKRCRPGKEHVVGNNCRDCLFFEYNDGSATRCRKCPPGYIGNARIGSVTCVPCPSGTYKGKKDFRCKQCKDGENEDVTGAQFCMPNKTPCPPGLFRSNTGACVRCTRRERFDMKEKKCIPCPNNHISKGYNDTDCTRCPRGQYLKFDDDEFCRCKPGWGLAGNKCEICPPGTQSSGSGRRCTKCDLHTFSPRAGLESCLPCPANTIQLKRGQTKCVRCPRGLVSAGEGPLACVKPATNCPPNHIRRPKNRGYAPAQCIPLQCPRGTVLIKRGNGYNFRRCGICENFQRYDRKSKMCVSCNGGYSMSRTSELCLKCPNGMKFEDGECGCEIARQMVNGTCVSCPMGTFGRIDSSVCLPCPTGTFSNETRSYQCDNCVAGTFSNDTGAKICKPCPAGTVSFGVGETGCVRPAPIGGYMVL